LLWVYLVQFGLVIILVAWQHAWPAWLRLWDQPPDLAVILLVAVGLSRGPVEGCWSGLNAGLLMGALGSRPLGGLFVSHMGAGALLGLFGGRVFPDRVVVAMLVTAVAVVTTNLVEMLFLPPASFVPWLAETFAQAALSGLVAAPLFALLRSLFGYFPPSVDR
jgi:hypothetical protein